MKRLKPDKEMGRESGWNIVRDIIFDGGNR
jgi:hypothetical protein